MIFPDTYLNGVLVCPMDRTDAVQNQIYTDIHNGIVPAGGRHFGFTERSILFDMMSYEAVLYDFLHCVPEG